MEQRRHPRRPSRPAPVLRGRHGLLLHGGVARLEVLPETIRCSACGAWRGGPPLLRRQRPAIGSPAVAVGAARAACWSLVEHAVPCCGCHLRRQRALLLLQPLSSADEAAWLEAVELRAGRCHRLPAPFRPGPRWLRRVSRLQQPCGALVERRHLQAGGAGRWRWALAEP